MRKTALFLISVVLFIACNRQEAEDTPDHVTKEMKHELNHLLPEGKVNASIMDSIKDNPRQRELALKVHEGIKKNHKWFAEYMENVPEGQPAPYHPNLGVSEDEYRELQRLMEQIELAPGGQETLEIIKSGAEIKFKAKGKLAIMEQVHIRLDSNIVRIGKYDLAFTDTIYITDEHNALGSKWKGYAWYYEYPGNLRLDSLNDISRLNMRQYKFTIGHLEKTGKTYMSVKGREISNGIKDIDFEVPVIF